MKLSEWAKEQGISYKTAWRWFNEGKLPVPSEQVASGTIIVKTKELELGKVGIYARVSSSDQKSNLDGQVARLLAFANANGFAVSHTVTEIGSGLNGNRSKLIKLLADSTIKTIIVEHRDRLMRFGCEYVEAALHAQGRKVVVVDSSELKDDLLRDMVEVLTSFCARLYGRRTAKNKAEKALKAMETTDKDEK